MSRGAEFCVAFRLGLIRAAPGKPPATVIRSPFASPRVNSAKNLVLFLGPPVSIKTADVVTPAKAGVQSGLDSRFRGNDRTGDFRRNGAKNLALSLGLVLLFALPCRAQVAVQGKVTLRGNVTLGGLSISLSSSQNPSTYATAVTFTAAVTPSSVSGSVTFYDGATNLGTVPLASGSAALTISTLAVGTHSITAVFSASGAASPAMRQTVNSAASSVSLSSSANPAALNQSVTFTGIVAPSLCTGTITFYNLGASIGSGTISGGIATVSKSWGSAGSESITATYSGDSNCGGSNTGSALAQTVSQTLTASSVALYSSPAAWYFGQQITFTATITPAPPTGETVTFYDTTGGVPTNIGTGATISGGTATISPAWVPASVAQHSITASYPGDGTLSASTSSPLVQNVGPWISQLSLSQGPAQMGFVVTVAGFSNPPQAYGCPANCVAVSGTTVASPVQNGWNPGAGTVTVQVPATAPQGNGSVVVTLNNIPSNGAAFMVTGGFGCQ